MAAGIPLNRAGSDNVGIPDLVAWARAGRIRVPSFQRGFAWNAADVRKLFDSIYRGFPVGTVILWRQPGRAGTVALGPIRIDVDETTDALTVVDGQQRITSLFGALSPEHQGVDERFEVYFDLETEKFVNPRRGVVGSRWLPVRQALETRSLLTWLREHEGDLEPEHLDAADRLGGVLREYRIPLYVVEGDDQNLLREVFDRVNSAGKPISRAQVFHALFAGDEVPGSPASVRTELRRLGFGSLDETRIVQSLLAIRGGNVQRDVHDEFDKHEDPADWYDHTEQALVRAIEFLRAEGVPHVLLMPSMFPLPVLAAFFALHPEPSPWNLRLLARWLWRGWVHGFDDQESGQTPALRKAVRIVHPTKGDRTDAPSEHGAVRGLLESVPDLAVPPTPLTGFRTDKASSRLLLLALASLRPRTRDGDVLDLARLLDQHGVRAITEFVSGYRAHAAARGFWQHGVRTAVRGLDAAVLDSHLISREAAENIGKPATFVELRARSLEAHVRAFLANKLEKGALVRPPLADLVTAGNAEDD